MENTHRACDGCDAWCTLDDHHIEVWLGRRDVSVAVEVRNDVKLNFASESVKNMKKGYSLARNVYI